MELTKEQIRNMTLEEAKRIMEENGFTDRSKLYRGCKQLYNWLWRNVDLQELFGDSGQKKKKKNEYDINKVIGYLERWAEEEGTTVEEQAAKYGYWRQYKKYIKTKGNEEL